MQGESATRLIPSRLRGWLPEIALILLTTCAGLWAAGRWLDPFDDPAFPWSVVYRLCHGERLYRDIYVQYTPLSFYLLAWGARVFGTSARYFLIANWVPAIVSALLLLRCGRRFLSNLERMALAGIIMASSLFVPGGGHLILPYNPGVVHALAFSLGALLLIRPSPGRLTMRALAAGALAGLAFSCKQEIGAAALLALGTAALAGNPRPLVWVTSVFCGFLTVLLPVAIFILSLAPLETLKNDCFFWPLAAPPPTMKHLLAASMGLEEPHWPAAMVATVFREVLRLGLIAIATMLAARERNRATWIRVGALVLAAGVGGLLDRSHPLPSLSLSTSVAFVVAILAFFLVDLPGRPFLVAVATFAGLASVRAAFSKSLGSHYSGPAHLASALTTLVFLVVVVPRLLLGEGRSALYFRRVVTILLLSISLWQTAKAVRALRDPSHLGVETREGTVFAAPDKAQLLRALARDSTPGERMLAFPENHALDVLFHLESLSPLINAVPGFLTVDIERQVIRRSQQSPPALVVISKRTFRVFDSEPFGVGYGLELADWLSRDYRVVESFRAGQILRRREETVGGQTSKEPSK
ncbi:MAG TPA: hypothetical protein VF376_12575 [Thermoanaerobaculia bacterium]